MAINEAWVREQKADPNYLSFEIDLYPGGRVFRFTVRSMQSNNPCTGEELWALYKDTGRAAEVQALLMGLSDV